MWRLSLSQSHQLPPLYPGKSLVPLEGSTRIVAVANLRDENGNPIDPSALSYAWTVDDTAIADSSGIGKDAIMVDSPLEYRSSEVSVAVQSQDGTLVGGDSLSLTPSEPTVRVYDNDPLLGILFDHALSGNYSINTAEDTLYAAPFSMPTSARRSAYPVVLERRSRTDRRFSNTATNRERARNVLHSHSSRRQESQPEQLKNFRFPSARAPSTGLFGL